MDRNVLLTVLSLLLRRVALRKESVDRNTQRRDFKRLGLLVALRKESVDRNREIYGIAYSAAVALRKESVDRNVDPDFDSLTDDGRSPQGERG